MSLSMPIEKSLWHTRIGTYTKKIKVPRFPLIKCHFSVLFFPFLFLLLTIFSFQNLLLIHYIVVMYSFNLHHLLLLQSGDILINPGPMKSSRLNFCQ